MFGLTDAMCNKTDIKGIEVTAYAPSFGNSENNRETAFKVAEMKAKLAESEVKSGEKNVEIQEKIVEKTKIVREKGRDIIKYIDREVVKYDDTCKIPDAVVRAHNAAAKNEAIK